MKSSKMVEIRRDESGAVSASVEFPSGGAQAKKVISVIGKCSRAKSTLINGIIGHTAPFFVNSDSLRALEPITTGIDFYDDGNSIFLVSEGAETMINKDNDLNFMILYSVISVSNTIILVTEYLDIDEPRGFSRKLLSELFISNMISSNGKKKLIIVLRDINCEGADEAFRQCVTGEIWSSACESYREICEEEKNRENDQYSFGRYFELSVLFGEFSQEKRMYKDTLIHRIRTEIKQSNEKMQMAEIKHTLNDIIRNFNENAFPDPRTIFLVNSIIKRTTTIIRDDCLSKDPEIVANNISHFIETEKNKQKEKMLPYVNNLSETARKYLDIKLTEIYKDLLVEWALNLMNYTRAQIYYYHFKINCANLCNEIKTKEICNRRIMEYGNDLERELRNIEMFQYLKTKIIERSNIFAEEIKHKIASIISKRNKSKINIALGILGSVLTAGIGAPIFLTLVGLEIYSAMSMEISLFLRHIIDESVYASINPINNLSIDQRNLIENEMNQLSSEMENLLNRFKECKTSKLLLEIDEKIIEERPREFSEIDLEIIFKKSNSN